MSNMYFGAFLAKKGSLYSLEEFGWQIAPSGSLNFKHAFNYVEKVLYLNFINEIDGMFEFEKEGLKASIILIEGSNDEVESIYFKFKNDKQITYLTDSLNGTPLESTAEFFIPSKCNQ